MDNKSNIWVKVYINIIGNTQGYKIRLKELETWNKPLVNINDVNDWKKMTRIAGKYIYSILKRLKHHYSDWITVAAWNTGLHNLQTVCGRFPDEKCVRKNFPQAAGLADLTNQWYYS